MSIKNTNDAGVKNDSRVKMSTKLKGIDILKKQIRELAFGITALLVLIGGATQALAVSDGWMEDFDKAKVKAAKEGKDILINFTGSKWCGWCIKLHKEVFDKDYFKTEAPKSYILVSLDFPRGNSGPIISPAIQAQNDKLQREFNVQVFPTIFLVDAKGKPFGEMSPAYQEGGPENYLKLMKEKQAIRIQRDKHLADMAKAKPKDKAKFLDRALELIPFATVKNYYQDELKAIKSMESDGAINYKDKYEVRELLFGLENRLGQRTVDAKAIIKDIDNGLAKFKMTKEQTQSIYVMKFFALQRMTPPAGTEAILQKAYDTAPNSDEAKDIKATILHFFPKLLLPGTVNSSMKAFQGQEAVKAFDGDKASSFFVSAAPPKKDDAFELVLKTAKTFKTASVFTGHSNYPEMKLHNGVLEVSYDGTTYEKAAKFEEGNAVAKLNGKALKAVRIKVIDKQEKLLIIREIVLE